MRDRAEMLTLYLTSTSVPITLAVVLLVGIMASLKFMWDARRPVK